MRAQLSLRRLILYTGQAAQKQVDENQRERGEVRLSSGGEGRFLAYAALCSIGFRRYPSLNAPAGYAS